MSLYNHELCNATICICISTVIVGILKYSNRGLRMLRISHHPIGSLTLKFQGVMQRYATNGS